MSAAAAPWSTKPDAGATQMQMVRPGAILFAIAAYVAWIVGSIAVFTDAAPGGAASAPRLSVRALLASDDFAEATTRSLFALGGEALEGAVREEVREQVAQSVVRIDAALELLHPGAHRAMGGLELTASQAEAALRVLRAFSDSRMVALSRAVVEVVQQSKQEAGGGEALSRRLSETLAPRLSDVVQLHREMFPMRPLVFQAEQRSKGSSAWQPAAELNMSFEDAQRFPSASDEVTSGVIAHAQALFEALEGELGEEMPKVPSEMMRSAGGGASSRRDEDDFWLMDCLARGSPSHPKVCACLASSTGHVLNLLMKLSKGAL